MLKKALEFYASDNTYDPQFGMSIFKDSGDLAKASLKELESVHPSNRDAEIAIENLEVEIGRLHVEINQKERRMRKAARMVDRNVSKRKIIDYLREREV